MAPRCTLHRFSMLCAISALLWPASLWIARPAAAQSPAKVIELTAPITLTSPLDYQVFQRSSRLKGNVLIRGQAQAPSALSGTHVEARLVGTSLQGPLAGNWVRLKLDSASGSFSGAIETIAGGFYQCEVHLVRAHETLAETTVTHVGVGEVFVVAGQSNATNYGEVKQTTQTGMVTLFDGKDWQLANDPEPGVQDTSKNGSFMPAFGDALYRKYHVPIGVAPVGHGSTSVRQWLPAGSPVLTMPTMTRYVTHNAQNVLVSDGTLFNGMMEAHRSAG